MVIKARGRRVNIICVPGNRKRHETEGKKDTSYDTVEYRVAVT